MQHLNISTKKQLMSVNRRYKYVYKGDNMMFAFCDSAEHLATASSVDEGQWFNLHLCLSFIHGVIKLVYLYWLALDKYSVDPSLLTTVSEGNMNR